jgi:hypothetical protein
MKSFASFVTEVKRSKIRQDSKTGDEAGVNTKNDTVGTVNITDEIVPDNWHNSIGTRVKAVKRLIKPERVFGAVEMPHHKIKEETISEGRPKKNATEDDPGSEHVVMQLRKVISTRGQHKVKHVSGETSSVSPAHAHKMLAHHDNLKTTAEKDSYAKRLHRSASSMHDAMSGKAETHEPKVSLAGKITGTQSEAFMDVTPNKRIKPVNMAQTVAEPKARNAPSSAASLQNAANQRVAQLDAAAQNEKQSSADNAKKELATRNQAKKLRQSMKK